MITTVSTKGQIVIPASIRKSLGLKPQSKLMIKLSDDHKRVWVEPLPEDPIESACGILAGERSLADILLSERREEGPFAAESIA